MMNEEIIIIAEHQKGEISPITYELVAFAKEIQEIIQYPINIIAIGCNIESTAKTIAEQTGINTIGINNSELELYNAESYIAILKEYFSGKNIGFILAGHTSRGFDYAPALAAKIGADCITAVEGCSYNNNNFAFTRSIHNGKIKIDLIPGSKTSVLTILPGIHKFSNADTAQSSCSYEIIESELKLVKSRTLELIETEEDDYPITDADVIVSAGRGIGKEENLEIIKELAEIFPKSAIGASRPICDSGWLDYKHQVGTTGKTVSPKLYIACGISGTVQHTSGMNEANLVVAINKDPNAAIFNVSDYCIIDDLATFISLFIKISRD